MDDLEALRRKRLAELQAQKGTASGQDPEASAQAARDQAAQQAAVERLLQQVLDNEARERLTRIRMSRPDFAAQVTQQLVALAQSGRLARRLTDADLKQVLAQLTPPDRDISITRK